MNGIIAIAGCAISHSPWLALLNAGFHEEADAWRAWLVRAVACEPANCELCIASMARAGSRNGFQTGSRDFAGASRSASATPPRRKGRSTSSGSCWMRSTSLRAPASDFRQALDLQNAAGQHLAAIWRLPDHGLWEARRTAPLCLFKVSAWVAVDRYVSGEYDRQAHGSCRIGAVAVAAQPRCMRKSAAKVLTRASARSCRIMEANPWMPACCSCRSSDFCPPGDERITRTIAAIERDLVEDGLVRRWRPAKAKPRKAPFWPAVVGSRSARALQGRHQEARATFERLLAVRNDLGLLAEEYDTRAHHLAGNFPQALSHLALVQTALALCGPTKRRGDHAH